MDGEGGTAGEGGRLTVGEEGGSAFKLLLGLAVTPVTASAGEEGDSRRV